MSRIFRNVLIVLLVVAIVGVGGAFLLAQLPSELVQASSNDGGFPLVISEVMSSNKTALADPDGEYSDYLELHNQSGAAVSLSGYSLSDDPMEPAKYPLPDRELAAGEYLVIYCVGKDRIGDNPLYAPFKLSASGESLGIYDTSGTAVFSVEVPALGANQVYLRAEDGSWSISTEYSPGAKNAGGGNGGGAPQGAQSVILNELMSVNGSTLADPYGSFHDWVELRNVSQEAVDIGGWGLTDSPGKPEKWTFPEGTVLEPGGYLLVFCAKAEDHPADAQGALYAAFALSSDGEEVALFDREQKLIDSIRLPAMEVNQSYARDQDDIAQWSLREAATPGQPNNAEGARSLHALSEANNPGIYFTEVLAQPRGSYKDPGGQPDWVEIYNASDSVIDLSGWGLSDKKKVARYVIPDGYTIKPGAYRLMRFDSDFTNKMSEDDYLQVSFGISAGETITLTDPQGNTIQRVEVPWTTGGVSYGKIPGSEEWVYYTDPTPGKENAAEGRQGIAEMPVANAAGGQYDGSVTVTLTVPEGCTVYYTTDCKDPTQDSKKYSEALTFNETTVLRARAYRDGYIPSTIETQTYFIGITHTLPIVSLVTDPDNLYSDSRGLFVMGTNAGEGTEYSESPYGSLGVGANFWMKWEHKAHIEMIYDGELAVSQNVGLRLNGQYSRPENQKGLRIYARESYEQGKDTIDYALFDDLEYTGYSTIVLRASGNDVKYSRIRDMVQTSLAKDTNVLYQHAQPAVLYINGEFFAHYNIRERVDEDFLAQHEGLDSDTKFDMIKGNSVRLGTSTAYKELQERVKQNGLKDPDELAYFLENVDAENLMDWNLIQIYTGNYDTGNVRKYKARIPGAKWKWVLFDLDWGMWVSGDGKSDSLTRNGFRHVLNPEGTGVNNWFENTFIVNLLKVPEYRDIFLTKCGDALRGKFSTASMLETIDHYYEMIKPEMTQHFEKWNSSDPEKGLNNWEGQVEKLRKFARERPGYMLEQAKDFFGLSSEEMDKYFHDVEVWEEE